MSDNQEIPPAAAPAVGTPAADLSGADLSGAAPAKAAPGIRGLYDLVSGHPTFKQFLRFAAVGVVGTVVHYAVMQALIQAADWGVVAATSAGFLAGASVSYVLNRKVTFVSTQPLGIAFVKYISALTVGLIINGVIVAVLTNGGLHYWIAQPIATGVVLFWNFGASRLLVFRN